MATRRSGKTRSVWIRLSTASLLHEERVITLEPEARLLWLTSIAWCREQERDGDVPARMVPVLYGLVAGSDSSYPAGRAVTALLRAGLWVEEWAPPVPDDEHGQSGYPFGGTIEDDLTYRIVHYAEWQQTTTEIQAQRDAGRRGAVARWGESLEAPIEAPIEAPMQNGTEGRVKNLTPTTPNGVAPPTPVEMIFEEWRQATGRNANTKLTPSRAQRIKRWLPHYSPEELAAAVRGVARSEFHVARGYTGLEHALKNETNIERFRDAEVAGVQLRDSDRSPAPNATGRPASARSRTDADVARFQDMADAARRAEAAGVNTEVARRDR